MNRMIAYPHRRRFLVTDQQADMVPGKNCQQGEREIPPWPLNYQFSDLQQRYGSFFLATHRKTAIAERQVLPAPCDDRSPSVRFHILLRFPVIVRKAFFPITRTVAIKECVNREVFVTGKIIAEGNVQHLH